MKNIIILQNSPKHENMKIDILIFWLKQHFETLWNDCIDLIKDIICCYEVYNLEIQYFHKIAYSMQYIQNTKYDFIKYKLVKGEIIYRHINMKQNSIFQFYSFVS